MLLRCRPRNSIAGAQKAATAAHTANEAIAAWCHTVDPEDSPLARYTDGPKMDCDQYEQLECQDAATRPGSPVSTVAGWSVVTGTVTLAQSSVAPPPYPGYAHTANSEP